MGNVKKLNNLIIPILVVSLIVVAFLAGTYWTRMKALEEEKPAVAGEETVSQSQALALRDEDHLRGNREARILLIEYSDLECPFCKSFHPTAQQIVNSFDGQVAWVYRHFPLDQLHSKARKEAEATECAAELGGDDAFWKMTDKIYEVTPANNGLDLNVLPDLAIDLGLDKGDFEECLKSGRYAQKIEEDSQSGIKAGVKGTPGNILLDTKTGKSTLIPGAVPFEQLKQEIEDFLLE
jgi:protein-disulfide isomerase